VKKINLLTKNSIQKKYLNKNLVKKLFKSFQKVFKEVENEINNPKKVLNILNEEFELNFKVKQIQKFKKYKTVVLIGMGGSILGAEAIYKFLEPKIKKKFYFFDNLEPKEIMNFKKKENLDKILFIIISKSGNTVETISNLLSLKILKKKSKNIILISEKNNNLLFDISKKFNLFYIEHKNFIGGRFAVLSEVGLIPSYLMGLNIFKLRANIKKFLKGKNKSFLKDSSIKLSSLLNAKKINNLIFINYSKRFEKFLFWNQQLIAESLGKKGKGFLPMISSAPKDHHSLLQLYLDGPRDKLFYIFSVEEKIKEKINIKKISNTNKYLHNKTLSNIKMAQKDSLIRAFSKNKIPFREFKIKSSNEEVLGELFSYFILETIIVGKLIKTNPFDQPAVEQVKIYTKKLLS
tara:strand:+ start:207 stop:1424 length:1218 start_codon:yes stop_codon:yes gene_type:complete